MRRVAPPFGLLAGPAIVATAMLGAPLASAQTPPARPTQNGNIGRAAEEAAAEEARKAEEERNKRAPEVVKESEREKVAVTSTTGTVSATDFTRRKIELKIQSKRQEMIKQIDEILKTKPPKDELPDLYFQKAELFLEEGQFYFFEGMGLDDAIAAALSEENDAKVLALQEKKEKALSTSKTWGQNAIKLYEEIEKKYPKYERMSDVLYSMGQAYWDRQDYEAGLRVYKRLIKDFPKSQYVFDAWLAFGEYYFQVGPDDKKDVNKALNSYIEAAKNQESQVFGYATYKQGWCYYNLSRYEKATEKFKEVILYSQLNIQVLGKRGVGLAKEARKDYVLAYAQYGNAQNAPPEFKTVAENDKDLRAMLERLADIYYGDGKDRDAIMTYQGLMKTQPENTKNPMYQGKIVKLASRIGEKRQVVMQVRKLVEEYKRVRGIFAGLKEGDPKRDEVAADLRAADDISDNTIRFLSTTWHNEARKTLEQSTFEYALELYSDYLELFSDRKESYEIRFYYAELLFRLERFEQAGEQYLKVYKTDPKGKWAEASAEESVRAYDEVVKDYNRQHKDEVQAVGLKERPIPDVKKNLLIACKNYIENYPNGKIAVETEYKIARTFWEYNYFNESTPRYLAFVEKHPDHDRAEQAANAVLDTYAQLEDYEKLNEAARTFQKIPAFNKKEEFKALLAKVAEQSGFKLISKFEKMAHWKAGDPGEPPPMAREKAWEEAGKRYLAFSDDYPKSDLADTALANAAASFANAGQLDRSIKVRQRLVDKFPNSRFVPDQIFAIAQGYEQIVLYKDAASWLEKFHDKYGKDAANKERARDALFNASIYRHGTGDTNKAVEDRELYLKSYPDAKDWLDVAYSVPTAWEESNQLKKAIEAYKKFADDARRKDPARALNAQYKAYRLMEKTRAPKGELERALKALEVQCVVYKKSGKPVDDVGDPLALVAFRNADEVLAKFRDIKIAKPDKPAEFKKTLEQKRKAKEAVDTAYLDVVKLKSAEWAVASLFRTGEANADLVKAINAVPPPKGLNDEQSQLFKSKLEEQTLPIEEAAANYMSLCLDKSAEFAVFNDWTKKCLAYLEENRPNNYPKNTLEKRAPVQVATRKPENGQGLILELPKAGEKPKVVPGSEPPPPPAGVKVTVAPAKKSEFDFDNGNATGGGG